MITVSIMVAISIVVIIPVVTVPIAVGAPLVAAWVIPAVGFGVAALPCFLQLLSCLLCLRTVPAMALDFPAIVVVGSFYSALALRARIVVSMRFGRSDEKKSSAQSQSGE